MSEIKCGSIHTSSCGLIVDRYRRPVRLVSQGMLGVEFAAFALQVDSICGGIVGR